MREVAIIGAGITPCKGRWVERTYYGLAQMAVKEAIADAGISIKDVDAVVYGIYNDIFELSAIPEHPLQGIIGMANKRKWCLEIPLLFEENKWAYKIHLTSHYSPQARRKKVPGSDHDVIEKGIYRLGEGI